MSVRSCARKGNRIPRSWNQTSRALANKTRDRKVRRRRSSHSEPCRSSRKIKKAQRGMTTKAVGLFAMRLARVVNKKFQVALSYSALSTKSCKEASCLLNL